MKNIVVLIIAWSILLGATSYASEYEHKKKVVKKYYNTNYVTNIQAEDKHEFGAILDAPNLFQFTDNWFLGFEGGKDLFNTDSGEGYFAFGKITYTGTLFSFKKE